MDGQLDQTAPGLERTGAPADRLQRLQRRNARLKEELRRQARQARLRDGVSARRSVPGLWRENLVGVRAFRLPLAASFALCVALPTLLFTFYICAIASGQYVAEARLAVRAAEPVGLDAISDLTGIPALAEAQDSLIVANYLESRALVEALDTRIGLRSLFSNPDIDWLSRLRQDAPIERLVRYWRRHINTAIESPSGIITVKIWAFSPQDALRISEAVVEQSEALVNQMGERARQDVLAQSQAEMNRAEARLRRARTALQALRDERGVIDPQKAAEGVNKLIEGLRDDLVSLDRELDTARRTLSADAPQVALLQARRLATQDQIRLLGDRLTARDGRDPGTIAALMTRYDELDLERQIAERQFTVAAAGLERARLAAERKRMYLSVFARPVPAQEVDYPYRVLQPLAALAGFALLWVAGLGVAGLVRRTRGEGAP